MSLPLPSIDQLQVLALPAPVSYTPQTWGWWAVLAGVLTGLAVWGARAFGRWRRNRYRREALRCLKRLRAHEDRIRALRQLPTLLKRVALSMPVSQDVGPLHGAPWQDFLQRHSPQPLPDDFARQLALLAYAPHAQLQALPDAQREQLFETCQGWVEHHHVAV